MLMQFNMNYADLYILLRMCLFASNLCTHTSQQYLIVYSRDIARHRVRIIYGSLVLHISSYIVFKYFSYIFNEFYVNITGNLLSSS